MGVKKELEFLKKQLNIAKGEFGKNPPNVETIEKHVESGLKAVENTVKVYTAKKKKIPDLLSKANAKLTKLEGIIKDGNSIEIIDLLKQALNDATAAEKEIKQD
jgi:hypothetical protein